MEKYWIENIHEMIEGYSDIESERRIWLGKDPDFTSSFEEDFNLLFSSFDFEDFIVEWEKEGLDESLQNEFIIFKNMLHAYDDKKENGENKTDEEILNDPNWLPIVQQAKKIIDMWSK